MPAKKVQVEEYPLCDVCKADEARFDCRIPALNTWGFVCRECFTLHNCGLGMGVGQELTTEPIVVERSEVGRKTLAMMVDDLGMPEDEILMMADDMGMNDLFQ